MNHYLKDTLKLAGPICVGQMGQMLFSFTDAILIGKLGAVALASAGFSGGVFAFFLWFGFGMATAVGGMTAQSFGNGSPYGAKESLRHGLVLNFMVAIIGFLLMLYLTLHVGIFGQSVEVAQMSQPYLICLSLGLIPMMMNQTFRQFSEALGNSHVPMMILMVGLSTNLFVDYVLIFGHFGAPELGLLGAGVGTLVARVLQASAMIFFVLTNPKFKDYLPDKWFGKYSPAYFRGLLKMGVPSGLQYVFETSVFATATIMVGWLGTKQQAAHQIALNLASLTFMFPLGLGMATAHRVGYFYGQNDAKAVKAVAKGSLLLSGAFMILSGIVFLALRDVLPKMYINDPDVVFYATQLIGLAAFFQIFDGTQTIAVSCLRGIRDTKIPTLLTFIGYFVVTVPTAYVLGATTELKHIGVWLGLTIGLMIVSILLNLRLFGQLRKMSNQAEHETHLQNARPANT